MSPQQSPKKLDWKPVPETDGSYADLPDGSRLVVAPMMTAELPARWLGWGLILAKRRTQPALLKTFRTATAAKRAGNGYLAKEAPQ